MAEWPGAGGSLAGARNRLVNHGSKPLRGRPPWVPEIDLVMPTGKTVGPIHHELVPQRDLWSFGTVGTDVQPPWPSNMELRRPFLAYRIGCRGPGPVCLALTVRRSGWTRSVPAHRLDAEDRVVGRIGQHLEVALDAAAHRLAIRGHDPIALGTLNLNRADSLMVSAHPKLSLASSPHVAHPLGLATAANEVSSALEVKGSERSRDRAGAPQSDSQRHSRRPGANHSARTELGLRPRMSGR